MRSRLVIIDGVSHKDSSKVLRVECDQMISALAPDRPDQPLGISVLPWRSRRNRLVPDAHGQQPLPDDRTKSSVPIANEMTRLSLP